MGKIKENQSKLSDCLSADNVVQKSRPLQTLWRAKLGLGELKVLDVYLSRIDSHNPNKRKVVFSKEEFEELLGVKRVHPKALEKYTDALMDQKVLLEDERYAGGFHKIVLFCESGCYCDKETGKWMVEMSCSPEAMEYVFNIETLGYLRYKLKNVLQLTSRYSYFMFLYLTQNAFRSEWEISTAELRQLLGCEDDLYKEYKYFNQRILKSCFQEVNSKTDIQYEYTPIRNGRQVEKIKFVISTSPKKLAQTQKS